MKCITLRPSNEERRLIERVKKMGFASLSEVIKCASLSYVASAPRPESRKPAA